MLSLNSDKLNNILADKTVQTSSVIAHLLRKKKVPGPFLFVVPLLTLTSYANKCEKWVRHSVCSYAAEFRHNSHRKT